MKATISANGKTVQVEMTEEQGKILGLADRKKTGYERVEYRDVFYSVNMLGCVDDTCDVGVITDKAAYFDGNYYSDEKIAENNARADRLFRQLRQWQAANDRVITLTDWKNEGVIKYFIAYNYRSSLFEIGRCSRRREPNIIYFTTKDKVSKAVKNFRDELEWYFTEYQQRLDEE